MFVRSLMKVTLAAGFDCRHIGIHHHIFRASESFDHCAPGIVVPVCMTD